MTIKRGFTLIEILVVIALIGVLAGLMIVAFQGTRRSSRDGKRKADLEQIRSALEMYKADKGSYPACTNWSFDGICLGNVVSWGHNLGLSCDCLPLKLAGIGAASGTAVYLNPLPVDPIQFDYGDARNRAYYYDGSANSYSLYAKLEDTNDPSINCPSGCGLVNFANYKVTNP